MSDLINESELILKGKVIQTSLQENEFSGFAVIKIEEILKGEYPNNKIKIYWGSEVHEQKIRTVGEERLLFLKKVDSIYVGTHYGRSYIPLIFHQSVDSRGLFIEYKYPTNTIKIDYPNLLKSSDILKINKTMPFMPVYSDSIILFSDLRKIINK